MSWIRFEGLVARMTNVKPVRLKSRRTVASISFDDFPKSAWEVGGKILARYNAHATYYTAGGFCGQTTENWVCYEEGDLRALAAAGHEIACHSFSHEKTPTLSNAALAADSARNAQFLAPFLGARKLESYAYPYGATSVRVKKFFASRFSNIRGVNAGINTGRVDLSQLKAVSLSPSGISKENLDRIIADARADKGWICFYSHDVAENPTRYGTTPAILEEVLRRLMEANIEVLPMREAFSAMFAPKVVTAA